MTTTALLRCAAVAVLLADGALGQTTQPVTAATAATDKVLTHATVQSRFEQEAEPGCTCA